MRIRVVTSFVMRIRVRVANFDYSLASTREYLIFFWEIFFNQKIFKNSIKISKISKTIENQADYFCFTFNHHPFLLPPIHLDQLTPMGPAKLCRDSPLPPKCHQAFLPKDFKEFHF